MDARRELSTTPAHRPWRWLWLLLGLAACGGSSSPPNLVLLISDDQDNAHLGFEGHPLDPTPNLDRLAREGIVFSTLHTAPRCRPSLATLLSGRWPHQSGIYANRQQRHLNPEGSLPRRLKAAGYATFVGGKYWEGNATAMGFDAPAEPSRWFVRRGQEDLFAFLREQAPQRPVFVWWAPAIPHTPHDPPARFLERFALQEIPLPPDLHGDRRRLAEAERKSLAMAAWFDEGVGELVEELERLGELEDTVFLFLIDNGWSNGRIAKGSPFEKGLRTPLVVSAPSRFPGGRRSEALVDEVDLFPTLLELAGAPVPRDVPGISLRPALEGRPFEGREALHGAVYGRAASPPERPEDDVYALYTRTPRWKHVLYVQDVRPDVWDIMLLRPEASLKRAAGDEDLFDLENDPLETRNLAADPSRMELRQRLRRASLDWWHRTGGGPLPPPFGSPPR